MINKFENSRKQPGFTLIELLVVVSILAVMAFTTVSLVGGYEQEAQEKLVHVEMKSITNAIYRFKADTGYFPKEGVFASTAPPEESALGFLFSSPEDGSGSEISEWDIQASIGWNGPYLEMDGAKRIATSNCDFTDYVAFDAAIGGVSRKGVEDVFSKQYISNDLVNSYSGSAHCFSNLVNGQWQPAMSSGQPYQYNLVFKNDNYPDCLVAGTGCIALLSAGQNALFDNGDNDDIVKILRVNN